MSEKRFIYSDFVDWWVWFVQENFDVEVEE